MSESTTPTPEPMTDERRERLLADVTRIRELVEGPWNVPDRRDMEALARIAQEVPALAAEVERLRKANADLDEGISEVLRERDEREELLDQFAGLVAPVAVIGEHSSGNDPWANAMDLVTPAEDVDRLRAELDNLQDADSEATVWHDEFQQAKAERDEARAGQERLIAEVKDERSRRADYVRTVETERDQLRTLLRDMVDPDPCSFDHHGGCQAHGYLNLKPGEKCPHAEAKELLALGGTEADR